MTMTIMMSEWLTLNETVFGVVLYSSETQTLNFVSLSKRRYFEPKSDEVSTLCDVYYSDIGAFNPRLYTFFVETLY